MYLENFGLLRDDFQWQNIVLHADVPDAFDIEENNGLPFSHCIYTDNTSPTCKSYEITGLHHFLIAVLQNQAYVL